MQIEVVDISSLSFDPANARKHPEKNLAAIEGSLRKFGQRKPIVTRNNVVIAGNGTLAAAKKLGWQTIQIVRADDLSATDAAGFALADNRTAEIAEWDVDALQSSLKGLLDDGFDLAQIGFDAEDLSKLLPEPEPTFDGDPDDVPENVDTRCKPGDLWQLGNHRLLCGDSTNVQHVEKLMNGEKADMVWTDPPYNVGYVGGTGLTIKNDKMSDEDFIQFLKDAFTNVQLHMNLGAAFYVAHSDSFGFHFRSSLATSNLTVKQCLIWVKSSLAMGRQDYQWKHEPILYGWLSGGPHKWYSDRSQTTVLEFDKPRVNDVHPTMKPIDLIEYCVQNSSKKDDLVIDTFLGSGSTLIACEKTNRKCYGMEIDPKYCDVILARWEKFTGKKAELLKNSEQ